MSGAHLQPHDPEAPPLGALLATPQALPSMPKVLALLLAELDADDPDPRRLAALVAGDPALTARVLQTANAAFFRPPRPIATPQDALAILGQAQLRTVATVACLGTAFRHVRGLPLQDFWRCSIDTAKLAQQLAGRVGLPPANAFTAGMVHAVGQLVLHLALPQPVLERLAHAAQPLSLRRARAEQRALGYSFATVGGAFARAWRFPEALCDAVAHQLAPFDAAGVYEPMAGLLHLAGWRARAQAAGFDDAMLADTYPGEVGVLMGLDIDEVLQRDPIDWTTQAEAQVLT